MNNKGLLITMIGFPGSGKSTWLEKHAGNAVVLCPDDFRKVITGQDFHAPAEDLVWGCVKNTARVLLKRGYRIIIDATHLTVGSRAQWVRIAKETEVPILAWWMRVPTDLCRERNAARDRVVPDEVLDDMEQRFEEPTIDEGFRAVTVGCNHDVMVALTQDFLKNTLDCS